MKVKKVIFFLIDLNVGGTEKSLLSLLQTLPDSYQITIFVLKMQGGFLPLIPKNVTITEIENSNFINNYIQQSPLTNILKFIEAGEIKSSFLGILNYVRWKLSGDFTYNFKTIESSIIDIKEHYDVAVAYAGPHDFITYHICCKLKAKKRIQWIHFDVAKVLNSPKFGNKYYRFFDQIVCVSKSAKEVFNNYFPQFDHKTIVIENVVSLAELLRLANEGETFDDNFNGLRILTLGRISSEKGQMMIPDIVDKLIKNKNKFRWYCIGAGSDYEALNNEIIKRDLKEYVVLLGTKLNPYRFLKDCDIYVQTSLHEGYGLTMKEAKCFNKPCVVTNVVSAKDFFTNNENGIVVDIDPESISIGVLQLINNRSLRFFFENKLKEENKLYENITIEL